ncbi:MAG TPA: hypothetical protein PKZ97_05930 [Azospirillaceae bacterium]|nr:hypothetical protein [Azospirillaceae bacterium]
MAVELIRLRITRPGAAPKQLFGGVVLHSDGVADFFGDTQDHAEEISALLDQLRLDAPFLRVTVEALERADRRAILADTLRIDERRVIGPLLLSPGLAPAVGGAIDAEVAARTHRILLSFDAARRAGGEATENRNAA